MVTIINIINSIFSKIIYINTSSGAGTEKPGIAKNASLVMRLPGAYLGISLKETMKLSSHSDLLRAWKDPSYLQSIYLSHRDPPHYRKIDQL